MAVQCKRCLVTREKVGSDEGTIEKWNADLLKKDKNYVVAEEEGIKHNNLLTESLN